MTVGRPASQSGQVTNLSRWLLWRVGMVSLLTSAVVLAATTLAVDRGFAWIERDRLRERLERAADTLTGSAHALVASTRDYAAWDLTHAFIKDPDETYLRDNYTVESTANLGVSWVAFVDTNRHVVHAMHVGNDRHGQPLERQPTEWLERFATGLDSRNLEADAHTVFWLATTPVLVGYLAITNSPRTAPLAGWLFFGRPLVAGARGMPNGPSDVPVAIHAASPAASALPVIRNEAGMWLGKRAMPPWPVDLRLRERPAYSAQRDTVVVGIAASMLTLLALSLGTLTLLFQRKVLVRLERFAALADRHALGRDADTRWPVGENDEIDMLAGSLNAMLERIDSHERVLAHLASHDQLTELGNRRQLMQRLQLAIEFVQLRPDVQYSLVLFDLDWFKEINDTHGHAAGDRVLTIVAERILALVRADDVPVRLGGDEFAVLLADCGPAQSRIFCDRLLESLSLPVEMDGQFLSISASIGSVALEPDLDTHELLRRADRAMYRAKRDGRHRARMFDQSMDIDTRTES